MHQTHPLPDTHPEFSIIHHPGFTEYKVDHWRLARDGSGRVVDGTVAWSWIDAVVVLVMAVVWHRFQAHDNPVIAILLLIVLTSLIWSRCTQVLHESILIFPSLGIQLETHLGHPLLPHPFTTTITTRQFIHLSALEDVLIHEGFRRWDVRYYLAVVERRGEGQRMERVKGRMRVRETETKTKTGVKIHVGFENILPYFPVLQEVYLGIQEILFPESNSESHAHPHPRTQGQDEDKREMIPRT